MNSTKELTADPDVVGGQMVADNHEEFSTNAPLEPQAAVDEWRAQGEQFMALLGPEVQTSHSVSFQQHSGSHYSYSRLHTPLISLAVLYYCRKFKFCLSQFAPVSSHLRHVQISTPEFRPPQQHWGPARPPLSPLALKRVHPQKPDPRTQESGADPLRALPSRQVPFAPQ